MLIYNNEHETTENKNWTKDKIELQHIHGWVVPIATQLYKTGLLTFFKRKYIYSNCSTRLKFV